MIYFPIIKFIPESRRVLLVVILSCFGALTRLYLKNPFSDFLTLLPIWWFGVELAQEYLKTKSISFLKQSKLLILIGVPILYYGFLSLMLIAKGGSIEVLKYPFVELRSFVFVFLLFIIALAIFRNKLFPKGRVLKSLSGLGGISFAIYVFHYPLICNLTLFRGGEFFWGDLALRVALVFLLSYVAERIIQTIIVQHTKKYS